MIRYSIYLFLKCQLVSCPTLLRLPALLWSGSCNHCNKPASLDLNILNILHKTRRYAASIHTDLHSLLLRFWHLSRFLKSLQGCKSVWGFNLKLSPKFHPLSFLGFNLSTSKCKKFWRIITAIKYLCLTIQHQFKLKIKYNYLKIISSCKFLVCSAVQFGKKFPMFRIPWR